MESFDTIYARAAGRKGGNAALESLLPEPRSARALTRTPDHRYLAEMTKRVFQSGFVWKVVEIKWQAFEEVFGGFEPGPVALMSDEALEKLLRDARIIRNYTKLKATRHNAGFVQEVAAATGRFGMFIAHWPEDDIVGLWQVLRKRGARLGGNTGPYFLRFSGKDTFLLSTDVVAVLIEQNIVSTHPTSLKDLDAVQAAFNQWREDSGRPLCQISRVIAMSAGSA